MKKLKRHTKKSGKKTWAVVNVGFLSYKILYLDQSKKACEKWLKLHL